MFKVTVKTQQCINIIILMWQHVSVLLEHFQSTIQRYEVVHIIKPKRFTNFSNLFLE